MNDSDFCQYQNADLKTKPTPADDERLNRQIESVSEAVEMIMEQLAWVKRTVDALNKDEK